MLAKLLKSLAKDLEADPEHFKKLTQDRSKSERYEFKKNFIHGRRLPKSFQLFFKILEAYEYNIEKRGNDEK